MGKLCPDNRISFHMFIHLFELRTLKAKALFGNISPLFALNRKTLKNKLLNFFCSSNTIQTIDVNLGRFSNDRKAKFLNQIRH